MPVTMKHPALTYDQVIARLQGLADPHNVEGMARFGINTSNTLGISVATLRAVAKETGKSHDLALRLWDSKIHEARTLASLVDEPKKVTQEQMEAWVREFDSWDVCDNTCGNLFDKTAWAFEKAEEWTRRDREFERRAGFALMAWLAVHDKKAADARFLRFLPLIEAAAPDDRNFVRKAVSWALRQVGKRNVTLNRQAIAAVQRIQTQDSRAARWIAADALKELAGDKVQSKIMRERAVTDGFPTSSLQEGAL